jgi:hypothetical protein
VCCLNSCASQVNQRLLRESKREQIETDFKRFVVSNPPFDSDGRRLSHLARRGDQAFEEESLREVVLWASGSFVVLAGTNIRTRRS